MPLVEQELLTLPEHMRSPPVFSGVRITRSLVLCQFITSIRYKTLRRVLRYQRDNQNLYMIEEQTTQWPKEKGQKDKQRSTKHAQVTQPPLKTGGELRYSGRVSSSCSNSGTRRFNIVTNPVIFHE